MPMPESDVNSTSSFIHLLFLAHDVLRSRDVFGFSLQGRAIPMGLIGCGLIGLLKKTQEHPIRVG